MNEDLFNRVPRNEALEAAGVTTGQDSLWRRAGLFRPQLGSASTQRLRWYTKRDFGRLHWLKRFVDDSDPVYTGLGLPITTMQALLARLPSVHQDIRFRVGRYFGSVERHGPEDPLLLYRFIDVEQRRLKKAEDVTYDFFAHASRQEINSWLDILTALYFAKLFDEEPYAEGYDAERMKRFERFRYLERAIRVTIAKTVDGHEFVGFKPALDDDRETIPSAEDQESFNVAARMIAEREKLIKPLEEIWALEEEHYEAMVAGFAELRQKAANGIDIIGEGEAERQRRNGAEAEDVEDA